MGTTDLRGKVYETTESFDQLPEDRDALDCAIMLIRKRICAGRADKGEPAAEVWPEIDIEIGLILLEQAQILLGNAAVGQRALDIGRRRALADKP